jgi:hypothetical protein
LSCDLIKATQTAKRFAEQTLQFNRSSYRYLEIKTLDQSKEAVAIIESQLKAKRGVQLGFTLWGDYSQAAKTGRLSVKSCDASHLCNAQGGHAVFITELSDEGVKIKNSWSDQIGLKGYQWVERDYLNYGLTQVVPASWSILYKAQ